MYGGWWILAGSGPGVPGLSAACGDSGAAGADPCTATRWSPSPKFNGLQLVVTR